MSTATATAADPSPPSGKGKKKLILIIVAAAVLVLAAGGGGAVFMLKKKAAAELEAQAEGEGAPPAKTARPASKGTPVFVALDTFTVNLADREAERYAQIGITLEIDDTKVGDQIKLFMPAIRNNILLAIADRTAGQLMDRDGKRRLALEVRRETSRALGVPVARDDEAPADKADKADPAAKPTKRAKDADASLPVRAVHFSNFIIQ